MMIYRFGKVLKSISKKHQFLFTENRFVRHLKRNITISWFYVKYILKLIDQRSALFISKFSEIKVIRIAFSIDYKADKKRRGIALINFYF